MISLIWAIAELSQNKRIVSVVFLSCTRTGRIDTFVYGSAFLERFLTTHSLNHLVESHSKSIWFSNRRCIFSTSRLAQQIINISLNLNSDIIFHTNRPKQSTPFCIQSTAVEIIAFIFIPRDKGAIYWLPIAVQAPADSAWTRHVR